MLCTKAPIPLAPSPRLNTLLCLASPARTHALCRASHAP